MPIKSPVIMTDQSLINASQEMNDPVPRLNSGASSDVQNIQQKTSQGENDPVSRLKSDMPLIPGMSTAALSSPKTMSNFLQDMKVNTLEQLFAVLPDLSLLRIQQIIAFTGHFLAGIKVCSYLNCAGSCSNNHIQFVPRGCELAPVMIPVVAYDATTNTVVSLQQTTKFNTSAKMCPWEVLGLVCPRFHQGRNLCIFNHVVNLQERDFCNIRQKLFSTLSTPIVNHAPHWFPIDLGSKKVDKSLAVGFVITQEKAVVAPVQAMPAAPAVVTPEVNPSPFFLPDGDPFFEVSAETRAASVKAKNVNNARLADECALDKLKEQETAAVLARMENDARQKNLEQKRTNRRAANIDALGKQFLTLPCAEDSIMAALDTMPGCSGSRTWLLEMLNQLHDMKTTAMERAKNSSSLNAVEESFTLVLDEKNHFAASAWLIRNVEKLFKTAKISITDTDEWSITCIFTFKTEASHDESRCRLIDTFAAQHERASTHDRLRSVMFWLAHYCQPLGKPMKPESPIGELCAALYQIGRASAGHLVENGTLHCNLYCDCGKKIMDFVNANKDCAWGAEVMPAFESLLKEDCTKCKALTITTDASVTVPHILLPAASRIYDHTSRTGKQMQKEFKVAILTPCLALSGILTNSLSGGKGTTPFVECTYATAPGVRRYVLNSLRFTTAKIEYVEDSCEHPLLVESYGHQIPAMRQLPRISTRTQLVLPTKPIVSQKIQVSVPSVPVSVPVSTIKAVRLLTPSFMQVDKLDCAMCVQSGYQCFACGSS